MFQYTLLRRITGTATVVRAPPRRVRASRATLACARSSSAPPHPHSRAGRERTLTLVSLVTKITTLLYCNGHVTHVVSLQ